MKDLIKQMTDIENSTKEQLNEAASLTVNAETGAEIADMISAMQGNAGMGKPVAADMPMPMRHDIDKFRAAVDDDPSIPGRDDVDGDQDLQAGLLGALGGAAAGSMIPGAGAALGGVGAAGGGALGGMIGGPGGAALGSKIGGAIGRAAPAAIGGMVGDKLTGEEMEADNTMNSILAKWIDHYNSDIGSDGAGAAMQEIIDDLNQDNGLIADDYPQLQKFAEKLDGGWEIVDEKIPGSTGEEQLNTLVKTINDDQYITSLFKQQTDQWDFGTDEEKEGKTDEWANSAPGEDSEDRGDMGDYEDNIRDGDDLHAKKNRKAIRTVNPALENIKETLYKALSEKKAKPDYIDIDGDGDKKEPMKKAVKDKKSKKVGEGAVKGAMMNDAEKMSLKAFIKKYGEENRDTWKAMNEAVIREGKMPSKAHVMKMCKDGMSKAEMLKMHPDCDQAKLKTMIDGCKKEMKESLEEAKLIVEAGCVGEMKKLNASGCTKEAMYKKINAEYNCGREKFEKLYAAHCG